jgi:RNA polymerase sigma-70 factor, ECF subfamily
MSPSDSTSAGQLDRDAKSRPAEWSAATSGGGSTASLLDRVRAQDVAAWRQLVELYGPLIGHWCRRAGLQAADVADVTQAVFMVVARQLPDFRQPRPTTNRSLPPKNEPGVGAADTPLKPTQTSGRFRSWLAVVTRRKLIDWRRAQRPDQAEGGSSAAGQLQRQVDPLTVDPLSLDSLDLSPPAAGVSKGEANAAAAEVDVWEVAYRTDTELSGVWDGVVARALKQIQSDFQASTWLAFWRVVIDGQSTAVVAEELGMTLTSVRQAKSRILRRLRQQLGDL